jgi:putative peptidoglycan lipid II flippase
VLFQHGKFSAADTAATAPALAAYAAGLPAFVIVKVMAPGFFARQDTGTPVKIAAVTMAVNVALTIGLGLVLAQTGIALALTTAGWVNALSLTAVLHRRGHFALDQRSRRSLPRILLAALGMGVALALLDHALRGALAGPLAIELAALTLLVGGGLLAFAVLAVVFGALDWRELKRRLRRRAA